MENLTLIWLLNNNSKNTEKTLASLVKLRAKNMITLLIAYDHEPVEQLSLDGFHRIVIIKKPSYSFPQLLNACRSVVNPSGYVSFIENGDILTEDAFSIIFSYSDSWISPDEYPAIMLIKAHQNGTVDTFSNYKGNKKAAKLDLNKCFSCFPYFLGGTILSSSYFTDHSFREDIPYDYEKEYLMKVLCQTGYVCISTAAQYQYASFKEGNSVYYKGVYERNWYYESITDFWIPFFKEISEDYGMIPEFLQYFSVYCIGSRFRANLNNTNKHIIPHDESYDYMRSYQLIFSYISDDVIMNGRNVKWWLDDLSLQQLYLKLKYGNDHLNLDRYYFHSNTYLGYGNVVIKKITDQNVNIKYMNYNAGSLYIDASISPYLNLSDGNFFIRVNGKREIPTFDEIYSHSKCFGVTYSKRQTFHIDIPFDNVFDNVIISFFYKENKREWKLAITYDSHFSRLTKRFKNSHWIFGDEKKYYIARHRTNSIKISPIAKKQIFLEEGALLKEMFLSRNKAAMKYAFYRIGYFFMRLFYRKKKIWFYMDKIYKAGDSSEYLYKYAVQQKERNVKHYYLVDKSCPDYKRLRKEGYHPLIRGSIRHRLLFLLADWVIASNSTVYAFNDYTLEASAYIRDLPHFKTACVQHGMSVQKIAVAQNRLRDNIGLYFCASKYEIENLNHPIYGYVGTNILKLTGVPRYDGLISNDKKQILISPTWRMQAAVPVSKNEGVARDYNPLFKDTAYYKVYNELINNARFIDSAKKYGYRILFVLHPIVSPQIDDFDKNDYVELIPSTGEMSYEKIFCESSLMVTDFSGVQYDFAYMRKPVVYLHHWDIPKHYEEGVFRYDSMAFGEICIDNNSLIDTIIEYMQNGCRMKEQYRQRADDFFYYNDHNNCERIYREMLLANEISYNNNNVR